MLRPLKLFKMGIRVLKIMNNSGNEQSHHIQGGKVNNGVFLNLSDPIKDHLNKKTLKWHQKREFYYDKGFHNNLY